LSRRISVCTDATCTGGDCWNLPTNPVSVSGQQLEVTVDAASILLGTPFVAGDPGQYDPTAVTLQGFNAQSNGTNVLAGILLIGTVAIASIALRRLALRRTR
jgi:hypothetical protein